MRNVRSCRRLVATALLAAVVLPASAAAHAVGPAVILPTDRARGIDNAGLARGTDAHCAGMLQTAGHECTHGPDPAPPGRDVRVRRTTAQLTATTPPSVSATTPGTSVPPTDGTGAIVCDGDGVSGKRIQVLYVVASDQPDRFAALEATLGQDAINADRQYNASAAQNGAARHLRFVTAPDGSGGCNLDLRKVVIGAADDDTLNASITAIQAQGYNRADRKYLMFTDANVYCGIGTVYRDSQPGQANINNGSYAQYARADNGCWNYAEAHELMHNLGGVQPDAPHSTPNFHCYDEYDEMCYDDDGSGPVTMSYICASSVQTLFDCGDDDYFNAGTVPAGTYLSTHWNTAQSAFLIAPSAPVTDTTAPTVPAGLTATGGTNAVALSWTANTDPDLAGYRVMRGGVQVASVGKVTSYTDSGLAASTTYSYTLRAVDTTGNVSADSPVATATTAAPAPAPFTETLSGAFGKRGGTTSYARTAAAGASSLVASGTVTAKGSVKPASVTVTLTGPTGAVLYSGSGTSLSASPSLPATGTYTWAISGAANVKYSLKLTYLK
jgi:hypothetical protein